MTKKKNTKGESNRTFKNTMWIGSVIIMLMLLAFIFRGWLRVTVIPKTTGLFYLHSVDTTFTEQSKLLYNPISSLGLPDSAKDASCNLQQAQRLHTEVDCSVSQLSYAKLQNVHTVEQQAAQLQTRLTNNGWHGGGNGVTLTSLIDGIAQGKDYSPDAYYEKVVNKDDCVFDVMIAYSNPQPPAIRGTFSCDRTINIFGSFKGQVYSSSKGHL